MALSEEMREMITEKHGEVVANFTITEMPAGGASETIREEWVGITMPVRVAYLGGRAFEAASYFDELTQTEAVSRDPVTIVGLEAVEALEDAGKNTAADFWQPYKLGEFIFNGHEGELTPVADAPK